MITQITAQPALDPSQLTIDWGSPYARCLAGSGSFCWVAGANYANRDIVQNRKPSISGKPFQTASPAMGHVMRTTGTSDALQWAGYQQGEATGNFTMFTIANILSTTSNNSRRICGTSSTTNRGVHLEVAIDNNRYASLTFGGVVVNSSVNNVLPTTGEPFVLAASYKTSGNTFAFAARGLYTNKIVTASTSIGNTPLGGDGIYYVGGATVFNGSLFSGHVAMAVMGRGFLPLPTLRDWVSNPYGLFKYPVRRHSYHNNVAVVSTAKHGFMTPRSGWWGDL